MDRQTRWGNWHYVGWCKTCKTTHERGEAVEAFKQDLKERPDLIDAARTHLKGKDLVCWCAPAKCHADIWVEVANGDPEWLKNEIPHS